jgi:BirA family biotin operon repressor/biotin-[acetyl-CoA-carboxylase] ligase
LRNNNLRTNERILEILKRGHFVSGAVMGSELGISRTALWKRIKSLREKGFQIEASPGKGYRLMKTPELSLDELRSLLKGIRVVLLDKTSSTNELAMDLAVMGYPEGSVIIADAQTEGKGRLGRKWFSPKGVNIYMSVILKPSIPPKDAAVLTLISAVSCAHAVRRLTGADVRIKWPNDLMVSGKKLGGILLEMRSELDRILFAVAGIGINVNMERFKDEISQSATSIFIETGKRHSRTALIVEILKEMNRWLKTLDKTGKASILNEWRRLSSTLGRNVMVVSGSETIKGVAEDIDEEGRLVIKTKDGSFKHISSGDVKMLR